MIKRLARTRVGRWLLAAIIIASAIGATYVATHTEGEITGSENWISVNIGPGAITVYANIYAHGWNGAAIGARYDHWDTSSTDLGSVAVYVGANGGVAVGIPGGLCGGYEVYGAPGDPGLWISATEC